jgi:hypothetical protein
MPGLTSFIIDALLAATNLSDADEAYVRDILEESHVDDREGELACSVLRSVNWPTDSP